MKERLTEGTSCGSSRSGFVMAGATADCITGGPAGGYVGQIRESNKRLCLQPHEEKLLSDDRGRAHICTNELFNARHRYSCVFECMSNVQFALFIGVHSLSLGKFARPRSKSCPLLSFHGPNMPSCKMMWSEFRYPTNVTFKI